MLEELEEFINHSPAAHDFRILVFYEDQPSVNQRNHNPAYKPWSIAWLNISLKL